MFKIYEKGNFYPADCLKEQFARCVRGGAAALFFLVTLVLPLSVTGCGEEEEPVYNPLSVNWTSPEVAAKLADYDDTDGDAVIGKASAIITGGSDGQFKETAVGNLIADGILAYANYISGNPVDIAITNGTSVGSDILEGNITRSDVNNFASGTKNDVLCLITYTGAEIKKLLNGFISSTVDGTITSKPGWQTYCVLLVSSGLSYEIAPNSEPSDTNRPTVDNVKFNGTPIGDDTEYRVATSDFFQGKVNTGLGITKTSEQYETFDESFKTCIAKYILAKGTISPVLDGRITGEVPVIPAE